eukprot:COSAG06_NODE_1710_length_8634_cov_767.811365_8_plen_217_part_00
MRSRCDSRDRRPAYEPRCTQSKQNTTTGTDGRSSVSRRSKDKAIMIKTRQDRTGQENTRQDMKEPPKPCTQVAAAIVCTPMCVCMCNVGLRACSLGVCFALACKVPSRSFLSGATSSSTTSHSTDSGWWPGVHTVPTIKRKQQNKTKSKSQPTKKRNETKQNKTKTNHNQQKTKTKQNKNKSQPTKNETKRNKTNKTNKNKTKRDTNWAHRRRSSR